MDPDDAQQVLYQDKKEEEDEVDTDNEPLDLDEEAERAGLKPVGNDQGPAEELAGEELAERKGEE